LRYTVVAYYEARLGAEKELEWALREVAPLSRDEPGCREYQVHRSADRPSEFLLYEQYDDEAAYAAHQASEHFERLIREQALPLLTSRKRSFYWSLD
jgi:quinol monooxygenase YgiN